MSTNTHGRDVSKPVFESDGCFDPNATVPGAPQPP